MGKLNEFTARSIDEETGEYRWGTDAQDITKAFVELRGILTGMAIDQRIDTQEESGLRGWSFDHSNVSLAPIQETRALIKDVLSDGFIDEDEFTYLMAICDRYINDKSYIQASMLDLELQGIIKGIIADQVIELNEISGLMKWIESLPIESQTTLKVVHDSLERILEDGEVDSDELIEIEDMFNYILDPIVRNDATVSYDENAFCLSGNFKYGSKDAVSDEIRDRGGLVRDNVTKDTDYIVVGGRGCKDYAFKNYGTKVRKAIVLQQKGNDIQIIHEDCLSL